MSISLNGSAEVLDLVRNVKGTMNNSIYTPLQKADIRHIAMIMLQGWGRVPNSYEVSSCLRRAEQLYLESLKVGVPEPTNEGSPPVVET